MLVVKDNSSCQSWSDFSGVHCTWLILAYNEQVLFKSVLSTLSGVIKKESGLLKRPFFYVDKADRVDSEDRFYFICIARAYEKSAIKK